MRKLVEAAWRSFAEAGWKDDGTDEGDGVGEERRKEEKRREKRRK
jgi:hypothetical protein